MPRETEHRDAEVNHLTNVLEPLTDGEPAYTAVITGPNGGETCISKFAAESLRDAVHDIEVSYVNCWQHYTRYRTLYQILEDISTASDIHRQSTPRDVLTKRLETYDGQVVVILDEVDQLEDLSLLYDLHTLPQFALLCIANRKEELFGCVDDRLVSRLRSSEQRSDGSLSRRATG